MDTVIAIGVLAATVTLAVVRPRFTATVRFTPGLAALAGVIVLLVARLLTPRMMLDAATVQWRPLLTLTAIMILTGVVQEVGAFERLAARIEALARTRSATMTFSLVFLISVVTPSLLNNDAAILILTPLVVALTRRLYPNRPDVTLAFAFAVFLAPGVAPFIVSNPMNMIVAEYAGLAFGSYAIVMVPLSIVGAALTYALLRWAYRHTLATATISDVPMPTTRIHRHPGERPAVILMFGVFVAYPIAAALDIDIWIVAVAGAAASLVISRIYRIAPLRKATSHVSVDILVFLWGIFLVVQGFRSVGIVEQLHAIYAAPPTAGGQVATIGVTSAVGSALIDNHPMSILNMLALDASHGPRPLLAALVGGDIGPRLLPIGSLAGLLWIDLLRRAGIRVRVTGFIRIGTLVLVPTLTVSLLLLWLIA